jgi:phosphoglycolate phosphatase
LPGITRLVVFDLDGTLVDSRQDIVDSANALLGDFDVAPLPEPVVVAMVGEGARTLVARVLAAAGVTADVERALARFIELYDARLTDHTRPYPGVVDTLEALDGRTPMAVLTNKPKRLSDRLLDQLEMRRHFVEVVGGDGVHGRKPEPAGLTALMRAAGASAAETLMVGDSWVDVETARRAGARVCFATWGFGALPPDGLRAGESRVEAFGEIGALVGVGQA